MRPMCAAHWARRKIRCAPRASPHRGRGNPSRSRDEATRHMRRRRAHGVRKAELERALERIPRHPSPHPELEQYRTPPAIAAALLLGAHADGAIVGKRVLDLGCGTGTFAIGAALLGARLATGVEVDSHAV